jgi:excisionase family DNA binding protein
MDADVVEDAGWRARALLTVMQAAVILGIGRTTAYALARQFVRTKGESGLPVVRVGNQLRVPQDWLDDYMHGRSITLVAPPTVLIAQPTPKRRRELEDADVLQLFRP